MMAEATNYPVDELADRAKNLSLEKHIQSLFHDLTPPAHISRGQVASIPDVCDLEAFCTAFYHVYEIYGHPVNYECLIKGNADRHGCPITDCLYKLKQPKDVALLAVLKEDDKQIIWISSFTNCCQCINDGEGGKKKKKKKKHAEEFLLEDAASNNKDSLGSVLKGFKLSDTKSRELTLYITYQPCHKSAEKSSQKSCTETVKKLYNEHLKPKGVKLIIKPTHIFKAYWDDEGNEVRNTKHGMRILADFQIAEKGKFSVEAMTENDWNLLKETFGINVSFVYETSQRRKLDKFIDKELKANKADKDAKEKKVLKGASAGNKDESKDDSEENAPKKTVQRGKMKEKKVVKEAKVDDKDERENDEEEEHALLQK